MGRPLNSRKSEAVDRDIEALKMLKEMLEYLDYSEISIYSGVKQSTLRSLEYGSIGKNNFELLKQFYLAWTENKGVKKFYQKMLFHLEEKTFDEINKIFSIVPNWRKKYIYNEWFKNLMFKKENEIAKYKPMTSQIIHHFGRKNQLKKLIEEMQELEEAIESKKYSDIYEEMADVQILLDQLKVSLVDKIYIKKIKRTLGRIESGYYNK